MVLLAKLRDVLGAMKLTNSNCMDFLFSEIHATLDKLLMTFSFTFLSELFPLKIIVSFSSRSQCILYSPDLSPVVLVCRQTTCMITLGLNTGQQSLDVYPPLASRRMWM
jgi:hypothetical protein